MSENAFKAVIATADVDRMTEVSNKIVEAVNAVPRVEALLAIAMVLAKLLKAAPSEEVARGGFALVEDTFEGVLSGELKIR